MAKDCSRPYLQIRSRGGVLAHAYDIRLVCYRPNGRVRIAPAAVFSKRASTYDIRQREYNLKQADLYNWNADNFFRRVKYEAWVNIQFQKEQKPE